MLIFLLGLACGIALVLGYQWASARWSRPETIPENVTDVYRVGLCDEQGHIISTRIVKRRDPVIYRYHGKGEQTAYTYRYRQADGLYIYQVRGHGS